MKRYVKTFESFSYLDFNSQDSEGGSRKYNTTIDEILTWAFGSDWNDYDTWSEIVEDLLFINGNFMERGESIAALDKLNKHKDDPIVLETGDGEYGVEIRFTFDGKDYSFESEYYPFEDDDMDDIEISLTLKISDELDGDPIMDLANSIDISDYVQSALDRNIDINDITGTGFKNWFNLQRYGNN